jgi:branched-chain amino acid transport system substrate-binding protein
LCRPSKKGRNARRTEPAVDSQIITLQGSGADAFLIAATAKSAAQATREVYDIGWTPLRYLDFVSESIVAVMKPAGVEKSKGMIATGFLKDVNDAR